MMSSTKLFGTSLLCWSLALLSGQGNEGGSTDEQLLKSAGLQTDGPGLLAFFRDRSLGTGETVLLERHIQDLGSPQYKVRVAATKALIAMGPPALPRLRLALRDADLEVVRRAGQCLTEIEQKPNSLPALVMAATRLLTRLKPSGAILALIDYLPFTDDDWVEEEIFAALKILASKPDLDLLLLLEDPTPAKRAAAAYLVSRNGTVEHRTLARKLLADDEPIVRFRAAQGLLAGRDKAGVPTLIDLVGSGPLPLAARSEDLLHRLAGERAPVGTASSESRRDRLRTRETWAAWWRENEERVDLIQWDEGNGQLGFTIVAEFDSNKVWEFGADGKAHWTIEKLDGPMDCQMLPGGRVLIAEYQGKRVTERDQQGKILWHKQLNASPIFCQRLPSGSTFVATHNSLHEFTRDGKETYVHQPTGGLFLFSAQRLPNGHVVYIANPGVIEEFDPASRKVIRTIRLGNNFGGWCSVEVLPNGRFLIALFSSNLILELDGAGKTVWQCSVQGACHATRLPNGNTLVASMLQHKVIQVDRDGQVVRETTTDGRPWRVHAR